MCTRFSSTRTRCIAHFSNQRKMSECAFRKLLRSSSPRDSLVGWGVPFAWRSVLKGPGGRSRWGRTTTTRSGAKVQLCSQFKSSAAHFSWDAPKWLSQDPPGLKTDIAQGIPAGKSAWKKIEKIPRVSPQQCCWNLLSSPKVNILCWVNENAQWVGKEALPRFFGMQIKSSEYIKDSLQISRPPWILIYHRIKYLASQHNRKASTIHQS